MISVESHSGKSICLGIAGWALPPELRSRAAETPALARYGELFNALELNSTHDELHRSKTFAQWISLVPAHFRFALKMHRSISHVQWLSTVDEAMHFLNILDAFGEKLGEVLFQLPPTWLIHPRSRTFSASSGVSMCDDGN